jgi:transposase-like protein
VNNARIERDAEVVEKARRRHFTAQYKREVLAKADACKGEPGKIGELLRKEGLYSSHLVTWRKARSAGELAGLTPQPRGPKPKGLDPRERKIVELERENARLQARLTRAEALIDLQKKVSELLGIDLPAPPPSGKPR